MAALGNIVIQRYFGMVDEQRQTSPVVDEAGEGLAAGRVQSGLLQFGVALLHDGGDVLTQLLIGSGEGNRIVLHGKARVVAIVQFSDAFEPLQGPTAAGYAGRRSP